MLCRYKTLKLVRRSLPGARASYPRFQNYELEVETVTMHCPIRFARGEEPTKVQGLILLERALGSMLLSAILEEAG